MKKGWVIRSFINIKNINFFNQSEGTLEESREWEIQPTHTQ